MTILLDVERSCISGAPYAIGDEIYVQGGSDRYLLATVTDRHYQPSAPFGLRWVLTVVNSHSTVLTVRCDDNGRNRTRTHGVMPS